MSDSAFDCIAPILNACTQWTDLDRYGPYHLTSVETDALLKSLRNANGTRRQRELYLELFDWLDARYRNNISLSVLGY